MLDALIEPISADTPCGEYLKDNRSVYRGYRNAFNIAQSSFRRLIEDPDALNDDELVLANSDNWNSLSNECSDCLKNISKDMEIFSWHAVAQLFSKEPLENLSNSLSTFDYIVINFWDSLHPMPPEGKLKGESDAEKQKELAETRIKPLLQLVGDTAESGLLYMPLQMQTLIDDIDYTKYLAAEKNGSLSQVKENAMKALAGEKEEVTERILALGSIYDSLISIEATISAQCVKVGAQGVSFKFVKAIVEKIISSMKYMIGDGFSKWPLDKEDAPVELESDTHELSTDEIVSSADREQAQDALNSQTVQQHQTNSFDPSNAAMNREQAFMELQRVADYFLKSEPHSPVYLLLKRAIRWGGMSLPELMDELVGDDASVQYRISQLAGMESADHVSSIKVETRNYQPASSSPIVRDIPVAEETNSNMVLPESDESPSVIIEDDQSDNQESGSSDAGVSSFQW
ncbi:type VI secretion system ImpA family N-terminal domain-containing protein [Marinomonas sp. 15G1-11]|uniref:Type VI secretion system ImpA family N-terminal domain-containing protein n=1 Tax=Marinomonas phaeophyticola TaxID=3004091 RepID=A0ABT4JRE9_9GAMM|nr:type VI secretion system ImpA family N-terminal domain-containing protein [Marinomonas sp. 15G1-11]MCZ2720856.1 type VI secretion system ImpA family N-terminal domain-containing protein [Marinomonas sp. 15G1-11]